MHLCADSASGRSVLVVIPNVFIFTQSLCSLATVLVMHMKTNRLGLSWELGICHDNFWAGIYKL